MKIYRSVKTNRITQEFGENNTCARVDNNGEFIEPYDVISRPEQGCPAGFSSLYKKYKGHTGTDFGADMREDIKFPVEAKTEWEGIRTWSASGGNGVMVKSVSPIPLEELPKEAGDLARAQYEKLGGKVYVMFYFGHMDSVAISRDKEKIKFGQFLGKVGVSGATTGPHVHFTPRIADEYSWFWLDGDNGYAGGFDCRPWFENIYVGDVVKDTAYSRLMKYVAELEQQGKIKKAGMVRAIAEVVKSFVL